MRSIAELKVKIFADGADLRGILDLYNNPLIKGFTTNPTLMKKAGIKDYRVFALDILAHISDRPICFEVFADDFRNMELQAEEISSWGPNVYVKVPVTTTQGVSVAPLLKRLAKAGIRLNVTAMMTLEQVQEVVANVAEAESAFLSMFAGRIADTGRDPIPIMRKAVEMMGPFPNLELIWASPRELLNIFHAEEVGCHVITVTHDVLKKLELVGRDLADFSLETVRMFYDDAQKAGFRLGVAKIARANQ